MTTETLVVHGGSYITWRCGSGLTTGSPEPIEPYDLRLTFDSSRPPMRVQHKDRGTLLWPVRRSATVVSGAAGPGDLKLPGGNPVEYDSIVLDTRGRYLPRAVKLKLGAAVQQEVELYASPAGTRFGQAGGIYGSLAFENDVAAAWAWIQLEVTLPLVGRRTFVAQADQHGDFRLALDRLPALTNVPTNKFPATLSIRARATATAGVPKNPSGQPAVDVLQSGSGQAQPAFANKFGFRITPGEVARVASPQLDVLLLRNHH